MQKQNNLSACLGAYKSALIVLMISLFGLTSNAFAQIPAAQQVKVNEANALVSEVEALESQLDVAAANFYDRATAAASPDYQGDRSTIYNDQVIALYNQIEPKRNAAQALFTEARDGGYEREALIEIQNATLNIGETFRRAEQTAVDAGLRSGGSNQTFNPPSGTAIVGGTVASTGNPNVPGDPYANVGWSLTVGTGTSLGTAGCAAGTAELNGVCLPTQAEVGISDGLVGDTLLSITLFVTQIIGTLAILAIVVAGIFYMTSAGDAGKIETAKNVLVYAIGGLALALLAWVIVKSISVALGA